MASLFLTNAHSWPWYCILFTTIIIVLTCPGGMLSLLDNIHRSLWQRSVGGVLNSITNIMPDSELALATWAKPNMHETGYKLNSGKMRKTSSFHSEVLAQTLKQVCQKAIKVTFWEKREGHIDSSLHSLESPWLLNWWNRWWAWIWHRQNWRLRYSRWQLSSYVRKVSNFLLFWTSCQSWSVRVPLSLLRSHKS